MRLRELSLEHGDAVLELARDKRCGITSVRQWGVYVLLLKAETDSQRTVRVLAAELDVCKSVIIRAVDALSRRGLVHREKNKEDERDVFIRLGPRPAKAA